MNGYEDERTIDLCKLVNCNKQAEIDRLNNIINEAIYFLEIDMEGTALDKLKELKEGK